MIREEKQNARNAALHILLKVTREGSYSNLAVKDVLKNMQLSDMDRRLAVQIAYGTLENILYVDYALNHYIKEKPDDVLMNILRIGAYQILFLTRVPDSAAVNESVILCRENGQDKKSGFVNAVLRKLSADKEHIVLPDKDDEPSRYYSVKYSYPVWLVEKWAASYDLDFVESMLSYRPRQKGMCLVPNPSKIAAAEWEAHLASRRLAFEKGEWSKECYYVRGYGNLSQDPMYLEGKATSVSEAAVLVAHIAEPREGMLIIDACAAPGGKCAMMAQLSGGKADIIAFDIHPHRVTLIEKNARRLGFSMITPQMHDATEIKKGLVGRADVVLVDVPCSGLGVIDSKPDIKLTKSPETIRDLAKLQLSILETSSKYVKPGGTLIYCTCTITEEENEGIVKAFLGSNPRFAPGDLAPHMPAFVDKARYNSGMIQLFPHIDHIDGFFVAKMVRRA